MIDTFSPIEHPELERIFPGDSHLAGLMRTLDWSQAPLGPVEQWPAILSSTLSICLTARFPMAIYWRREGFLLYNDAWRPILGDKHPWALGRPAREVWPEIWETIDPLLESVRATGKATWRGDELLPMQRFGYTEECYFDYTFNPIRGQSGHVEGILNVVQETTYRILNDRRTRLLRELAFRSGSAKTETEACQTTMSALATDSADLPFAMLYLVETDGRQARLTADTGLPVESPARLTTVDLSSDTIEHGWPLAAAVRGNCSITVDNLSRRFGALPGGPWPEPTTQALVLPVSLAGREGIAALLVLGINPRHPLDDDYRKFFEIVASHVATSLMNAGAYSSEKRRAEALAELDRAKTAFFSNVSHEFRTPLTLILGTVEGLLAKSRTDLSTSVKGQLEVVTRNSLRLLRLVNTLLDFSRIEAGRVQAVFEPTDLAGFTTELASVFRSAIERAGLRLVVECPPLPEPVFVDREMWEKIVLNLLSNAFKHTFEGEISVTLRLREGARPMGQEGVSAPSGRAGEITSGAGGWEGQDAVELRVRDTGVGIPAKELARVFERFHRVQRMRSRTHEGTGIGLALVQDLVKLHGGSVRVESMIEKGSLFIVTVPLRAAHLPPHEIGRSRDPASMAIDSGPFVEEALRWLPAEEGSAELEVLSAELNLEDRRQESDPASEVTQHSALSTRDSRPRVLVVDDNADMRRYVAGLLSERYRVEAVADGEAALAAVRARRPELILSDVMMPLLDGFGLLRAVRDDPATASIPVILLSARAGEESRVEGLERGADDYLIKPFSARELLARVGTHMEMARVRREASARERELLDAAMLLNQELRHKQEQLVQSAKLAGIGELAAGIAHELNNPLNNIGLLVGNAIDQLQAAEFDRTKALHNLDASVQQVRRAATIINHLRTFARASTASHERVSMNRIIRSAVSLVEDQLRLHNIDVAMRLTAEEPEILGNAIQLEQVTVNLLSNARDAVEPAARKRIVLTSAIRDAVVEVAVSDTGVGIPPDIQSRVFDPFFTTKDVGKGTGLGLSISYGIIQEHQGEIAVESVQGKGTTFTIRLPLASGSAEA